MVRIPEPVRGVVTDIRTSPLERFVIRDDPVVIATMPECRRAYVRQEVGTLGGYTLETTNHCSQRTGRRTGRSSHLFRRCPHPSNGRNNNDSVNVIGHYDVRIEFDVRVSDSDLEPRFVNNSSNIAQRYSAVDNVSEDELSIETANGHEISRRTSVVPSGLTR